MLSTSTSHRALDTMNLSTAEFLAEEELISIVPNFNSASLRLLRQTFGPFEAGITISVPVWVALYLKERQKCNIVPPSWLKVEFLETVKEGENNDHLFMEIPSRCYMEIAQLLLQYASDDVPDAATAKTLICDVSDIRMAKLKNNMDIFVKSGSSYAQVNNLTQFEICRVREFFTGSLNILHRLQEATREAEIDGDRGELF